MIVQPGCAYRTDTPSLPPPPPPCIDRYKYQICRSSLSFFSLSLSLSFSFSNLDVIRSTILFHWDNRLWVIGLPAEEAHIIRLILLSGTRRVCFEQWMHIVWQIMTHHLNVQTQTFALGPYRLFCTGTLCHCVCVSWCLHRSVCILLLESVYYIMWVYCFFECIYYVTSVHAHNIIYYYLCMLYDRVSIVGWVRGICNLNMQKVTCICTMITSAIDSSIIITPIMAGSSP